MTNYHTHCNFCDGVGDPRGYAEEAMRLGMSSLGFSSHAPLPHAPVWTMKLERLPEYAAAINALKAEYAGRVEIYLGLEMDFVPGVTGPRDPWWCQAEFMDSRLRGNDINLDYRIGSVHFVGEFPDGTWFDVDGKPEKYARGLKEVFGGDIRRLVAEYYRRIRLMLAESPPDIVAHLDLVKLDNADDIYFREDEEWYRREVDETLDAVAKSGVIVEVNRRGITRKRLTVPYPSPWILEKIFIRRIPITLNADAHRPEELSMGYEPVAQLVRGIGFREVMELNAGTWKAIKL